MEAFTAHDFVQYTLVAAALWLLRRLANDILDEFKKMREQIGLLNTKMAVIVERVDSHEGEIRLLKKHRKESVQ